MIIDASVLLMAFLPDETHAHALAVVRDHVSGKIHLKGPALLPYELSNAILQAERRSRITTAQADRIIESFRSLDIETIPQTWGEMMTLARKYDRTAYDAAYLTLAQGIGETYLTGDRRLYNTVHHELDWVVWIEDYPVFQE